LQIQHEYKQQQYDKTGQKKINKNKTEQLVSLIFKPQFLSITVDLQTAFAAEAHLAEGK
jgi:hypothetical protein